MSWQKIARFAIAVFVIGFGGFVFLAMRQRTAPPAGNEVVRADPEAVRETGAGERKSFKAGKLGSEISWSQALAYKDGRSKLLNVKLTVPNRNGRTIVVTGDEGEAQSPPDRPDEVSVGKLTRHVRLTTDNGVELLGNEATFNDAEGIVNVPGPVTFTRGRMKGTGTGATYDRNRDVIWILADAHLIVAPDAAGAGAVDATAAKAGLARAENFVKLEGSAHLLAENRNAEADVITAYLDEAGEKIQRLELREHSRIVGTGANAQTMVARNIDLAYAPDGRTLQSSKMMEGAVIQLPGAGGGAARRIAGNTIDTAMAPDGNAVTNLIALENVQVDLPAEGDAPARRIKSATLKAAGANEGLQNFVFEGGVDFTESKAAAGKNAAVDRHARSVRLIIDTKPGLGAVQKADFRSNVRFVDGEVTAEAPRGLYNIDQDVLDLSPAAGETGTGPIVNNPRLTVQALNIHLTPSTQKLKADTEVRSTIKPQKAAATGAAGGAPGGRGIAPVAQPAPQSHMPAMLKQDKPVNVMSNRLEYDGVSEATYTGNALLVQDKSRIAAETIVMNDRSGNLTAQLKVRSTMMLEDEDPKTKVRKLTETIATADNLVYDDAKRLATYTATGATPATLKTAQGDMRGNRIDLYLKEGGSEIERAESDGNVSVKLDTLYATSKHLVYTADKDEYVLTGEPVISVKKDEQGSCKETRGNTMTYLRAEDRTSVVATTGIATETKPLPACPAELRH